MYSSRYASHLHPLAIYSRACINVLIRYGWVNRAKDRVRVPWIPGCWENVWVREARGSWIWEEVSSYRSCIGINYYFNSKLVKKPEGCVVIKHYSGTNTPKPRFLVIFDYSEWSKNHRVFSLFMQDYISNQAVISTSWNSSINLAGTNINLAATHNSSTTIMNHGVLWGKACDW